MRKKIWAIRVIAKHNVYQNKIHVINHQLKDQDISLLQKNELNNLWVSENILVLRSIRSVDSFIVRILMVNRFQMISDNTYQCLFKVHVYLQVFIKKMDTVPTFIHGCPVSLIVTRGCFDCLSVLIYYRFDFC